LGLGQGELDGLVHGQTQLLGFRYRFPVSHAHPSGGSACGTSEGPVGFKLAKRVLTGAVLVLGGEGTSWNIIDAAAKL
jgi:hypothetical protein